MDAEERKGSPRFYLGALEGFGQTWTHDTGDKNARVFKSRKDAAEDLAWLYRNKGGDWLFVLAIVKGLVEHKEATAYFGSTGGFSSHIAHAKQRGVIEDDPDPETRATRSAGLKVTELGRKLYSDLGLKIVDCARSHAHVRAVPGARGEIPMDRPTALENGIGCRTCRDAGKPRGEHFFTGEWDNCRNVDGLRNLVRARDEIVAVARLLGPQVAFSSYPYYWSESDRTDGLAEFFEEHAGHDLGPMEYGRFDDQCARDIACEACDARHMCVLLRGHAGSCSAKQRTSVLKAIGDASKGTS